MLIIGQGTDFGDILDYHLAPGLFSRILAARAPANELLGGGLRSPSAFLVCDDLSLNFVYLTNSHTFKNVKDPWESWYAILSQLDCQTALSNRGVN